MEIGDYLTIITSVSFLTMYKNNAKVLGVFSSHFMPNLLTFVWYLKRTVLPKKTYKKSVSNIVESFFKRV